jgi:LysM repeat protein
LTVQALNAGQVFNTVGQPITYSYTVTNIGIVPLTGPVTIVDTKTTVSCPAVSTVGNLNNALDPNEIVICTSSYPITAADLTAGSVTNSATAIVGGFSSSQVSTTVSFTPTAAGPLKLTKTASPLTFSQVGQIITYTYVIQNTGTAAIGPIQFTVMDNKISAPINCGAPATTLAPQQTITCTATYAIVQADLTAGRVINSATASGGGTNVSAPATTTITLASPGSGLTRGSTTSHTVEKDEWMIQIARCYGASFAAVRAANPSVKDPDVIEIGMILSIPNIGSNGNIYGRPCVGHHTVQSGDTWASIAQRYNADVAVLQAANKNSMPVGTVLKIPLNSAGSSIPVTGTTITPTITLTPSTTPTPTITFTPSPTGTTTVQATLITFPAGSSSTTINGTVAAQGLARYLLPATQGQILAVKVTAPANEVTVIITGPNGVTLNPLNSPFTWNVLLSVSGDYRIDIAGIAGAAPKQYTLEVSLASPVITSTATATPTP